MDQESITNKKLDEIINSDIDSSYNTIRYKSGEKIYSINDDSVSSYIILQGEVETKGYEKQKSLIPIRTYKKGDVVGLVDMVIDRKYSKTALTKSACVLAVISKEQINTSLNQVNSISSILFKGLVISLDTNNPGVWS